MPLKRHIRAFLVELRLLADFVREFLHSEWHPVYIPLSVALAVGLVFANHFWQINARIEASLRPGSMYLWPAYAGLYILPVVVSLIAHELCHRRGIFRSAATYVYLAVMGGALTCSGALRFTWLSSADTLPSAAQLPAVLLANYSVVAISLGAVPLAYIIARGRLADASLPTKPIRTTTYVLLLVGALPLVALGATTPGFYASYPRSRELGFVVPEQSLQWTLLLGFWLIYGLNFVAVELFFRGWLILPFAKKHGTTLVIPMATAYCCVHFLKPPGEALASFFGGALLGIVALRTGSLRGGIILHIGIGACMELLGLWAAR